MPVSCRPVVITFRIGGFGKPMTRLVIPNVNEGDVRW
jgi:hypothetical protein